MIQGWLRAAIIVALLLVGLPVALWLVFYLAQLGRVHLEYRAYPNEVFGRIVPYDAVLASKKWFYVYPLDVLRIWGVGRFECTFALVSLSSAAPTIPPSPQIGSPSPFLNGKAPWMRGPSPWLDPENPSLHDGDDLYFCSHIDGLASHQDVLERVARDPDTWWRKHFDGGVLYAPKFATAAVFHFGD